MPPSTSWPRPPTPPAAHPKRSAKGWPRRAGASPLADLPHQRVRFAHNSERQLAKLLDFYGIDWEYEPREFVLEWDKSGNPVQAFRPDFYLPAYDLFIEITTLNQKLVTKKNRKVRRLRELHPDVKVKIFYQRDYLSLLVKYGLEQPSQLAGDLDAVEPRPLDFDTTEDPQPQAPWPPSGPSLQE